MHENYSIPLTPLDRLVNFLLKENALEWVFTTHWLFIYINISITCPRQDHNYCGCMKITLYLCHLGPIGKLSVEGERSWVSTLSEAGSQKKMELYFKRFCYLFHLRHFAVWLLQRISEKLMSWDSASSSMISSSGMFD